MMDITANIIRSFSLLVSTWGGHKPSSCFLRFSIRWGVSGAGRLSRPLGIQPALLPSDCLLNSCSSTMTMVLLSLLLSSLFIHKCSTLFTRDTMITYCPSVGIILSWFTVDINRRSDPVNWELTASSSLALNALLVSFVDLSFVRPL
jgi:hypothetical protein